MKAELILRPVVGSYKISELPDKLLLTKCDNLNRIISAYLNSEQTDYIYGNLIKDDEIYNENTYYLIDITSYVKDELSDNYFEPGKSAILLYYSTPSFHVTASRIVFGDAYNKNQKAQLKLYFLRYD
jgi:hypothetical protein